MNIIIVPADAKAAIIGSVDKDDYILLMPEDIAQDPHQAKELIEKANVEVERRKRVKIA